MEGFGANATRSRDEYVAAFIQAGILDVGLNAPHERRTPLPVAPDLTTANEASSIQIATAIGIYPCWIGKTGVCRPVVSHPAPYATRIETHITGSPIVERGWWRGVCWRWRCSPRQVGAGGGADSTEAQRGGGDDQKCFTAHGVPLVG